MWIKWSVVLLIVVVEEESRQENQEDEKNGQTPVTEREVDRWRFSTTGAKSENLTGSPVTSSHT